jgi:hypothetical protein
MSKEGIDVFCDSVGIILPLLKGDPDYGHKPSNLAVSSDLVEACMAQAIYDLSTYYISYFGAAGKVWEVLTRQF